VQQELQDLKSRVASPQDTSELCAHYSHGEILREIQSLRTSITSDSINNPSYADVARTPPTSRPSDIRALSSSNTTPTTFTDTLYCTIDTSNKVDNGNDRTSAGPIRAAVEKEIRTRENHAADEQQSGRTYTGKPATTVRPATRLANIQVD
jgi:hypothetical protein